MTENKDARLLEAILNGEDTFIEPIPEVKVLVRLDAYKFVNSLDPEQRYVLKAILNRKHSVIAPVETLKTAIKEHESAVGLASVLQPKIWDANRPNTQKVLDRFFTEVRPNE